MNIYLIGYRGTGKSSVAPLLAKMLGEPWSWLDLDAELERRAERSIAQIFEQDGEQTFRDLEEAELRRASQDRDKVVATGGGVVGREANRELLRQGYVVWLTATPKTILSRVSADTSTAARRPNLTARGGLEEIEQLLAKRTPLYQSLADVELSTEEDPPAEVARRIHGSFLARSASKAGGREGD